MSILLFSLSLEKNVGLDIATKCETNNFMFKY